MDDGVEPCKYCEMPVDVRLFESAQAFIREANLKYVEMMLQAHPNADPSCIIYEAIKMMQAQSQGDKAKAIDIGQAGLARVKEMNS